MLGYKVNCPFHPSHNEIIFFNNYKSKSYKSQHAIIDQFICWSSNAEAVSVIIISMKHTIQPNWLKQQEKLGGKFYFRTIDMFTQDNSWKRLA